MSLWNTNNARCAVIDLQMITATTLPPEWLAEAGWVADVGRLRVLTNVQAGALPACWPQIASVIRLAGQKLAIASHGLGACYG